VDNRRSYYRILHVERDAPVEVIRSSYRTLMQRLRMHPDLGGDAAQAALLNEAYAILTDVRRRAAYDESLRQREIEAAAAMAGAGSRPAEHAAVCFFCEHPHELGGRTQHQDDCVRCASPLHPVLQVTWEPADQRGVRRIPRRHRLLFYSDWPQSPSTGRSRDISLSGMLFATRELISPGAVLKIESEACKAVARVSNCRETRGFLRSECLIGVEFISVRFANTRGGFVSMRT
jgi:curved DNA-binding protein CbpA